MNFKITRTSLIGQLREYCTNNGLTFETNTRDRGQGLQLLVVIDGQEFTPGEAAERYLGDAPPVCAECGNAIKVDVVIGLCHVMASFDYDHKARRKV